MVIAITILKHFLTKEELFEKVFGAQDKLITKPRFKIIPFSDIIGHI